MPKYPLLTDKCNFEPRAEAFSHIFTVEIAWGWQTDPSLLVHPLQALCRLLLLGAFLKSVFTPDMAHSSALSASLSFLLWYGWVVRRVPVL